ncbi:hypothetical protein H0H92_000804 [Tricholoma furcatifolium]|nr:hypothetical protein H0H92_000804 [Tricholoma furcatifolium]
MKFISIVSATLLAISSLVLAAPLEPRELTSQLVDGRKFYRAVYSKELENFSKNYVLHQSPTTHKTTVSDFAPPPGALYVFDNEEEAKVWGNAWCKVDPQQRTDWKLVEYTYSGIPGLKTQSPAWSKLISDVKFVDGNYKAGAKPTGYDIVEGPLSVGHNGHTQGYKNNGVLVWQGAFTNNGLKTLTVTKITTISIDKTRTCPCPNCNIM